MENVIAPSLIKTKKKRDKLNKKSMVCLIVIAAMFLVFIVITAIFYINSMVVFFGPVAVVEPHSDYWFVLPVVLISAPFFAIARFGYLLAGYPFALSSADSIPLHHLTIGTEPVFEPISTNDFHYSILIWCAILVLIVAIVLFTVFLKLDKKKKNN